MKKNSINMGKKKKFTKNTERTLAGNYISSGRSDAQITHTRTGTDENVGGPFGTVVGEKLSWRRWTTTAVRPPVAGRAFRPSESAGRPRRGRRRRRAL